MPRLQSRTDVTDEDRAPCSRVAQDFFAGKNVLLTGASGGLGRAFASRLASCGVATLVLSGRDEERLAVTAEACRGATVVRTVACELADPADVARLGAEAVRACDGVVDVFVHNGGLSSRSSFSDTDVDVDARLMQVNFLAGAALAKATVPGMLHSGRGGTVLWISSVQGLVGLPHRTSYAASKFAVQGYCEALRAELHSDGVAVCVASPGYVRTGLSRAALTGDGSRYDKLDEATAQGADPDDVAADILDGVARGKTEILVATTISARVALWLRFLAPSVLRTILVKRFDKTRGEKQDKS